MYGLVISLKDDDGLTISTRNDQMMLSVCIYVDKGRHGEFSLGIWRPDAIGRQFNHTNHFPLGLLTILTLTVILLHDDFVSFLVADFSVDVQSLVAFVLTLVLFSRELRVRFLFLDIASESENFGFQKLGHEVQFIEISMGDLDTLEQQS